MPLDGLGPFEDFFNYSRIAGIGQGRQSGADSEIVKSREDRVSISLGCLLIVLGQGHQEVQNFFLANTG